MKRKVVKSFVYQGLGFPVILNHVPVIEVRGVWTPDVDLNLLQKVVLLGLAHQRSDLTGNQIRFIRTWLSFNQSDFGRLLGVTHPAVVKWEKRGNRPARITVTTQRALRMMVIDRLLRKDEEFRQAFRIISELEFVDTSRSLEINAPEDLVAS